MRRTRLWASVAALPLLFVQPAAAQLGLKGGVNLTDFIGGDAGQTEGTQGLNLGASFGLFRIDRLQLVAEVYYRQKGGIGDLQNLEDFGDSSGSTTAGGGEVEVGLDYVEIPVVARVDMGKRGGSLLPYVFGGPAFGWKVRCGVVVAGSGGPSETRCDDLTQDLERTIRSYDMGIVLGAGLDFVLPRRIGVVNLDARYTGGLSKIGEGADALDIRNRAFSLMLGYSFGPPGFVAM